MDESTKTVTCTTANPDAVYRDEEPRYLETLNDDQWAQACRWRGLLERAGYVAELHSLGGDASDPFNWEWIIFGPGWNGPRVATIDIDGCGASWHGPDDLWLAVIGPSEEA